MVPPRTELSAHACVCVCMRACLQALQSLMMELNNKSAALGDAERRFAELEAVMGRIAARAM